MKFYVHGKRPQRAFRARFEVRTVNSRSKYSPRPHFYQTRSAWSVDQGSNKNHSPASNFAPTVTKFCVMWEGLSLPHDTTFGNCRCKIVDSRAFPSWSLIHGLRWTGLIKAEPGQWSMNHCSVISVTATGQVTVTISNRDISRTDAVIIYMDTRALSALWFSFHDRRGTRYLGESVIVTFVMLHALPYWNTLRYTEGRSFPNFGHGPCLVLCARADPDS